MLCCHFISDSRCCARGINYQQLAGGGIFSMALRLPCYPLSNRQGEVAQPCNQFVPILEPVEKK